MVPAGRAILAIWSSSISPTKAGSFSAEASGDFSLPRRSGELRVGKVPATVETFSPLTQRVSFPLPMVRAR